MHPMKTLFVSLCIGSLTLLVSMYNGAHGAEIVYWDGQSEKGQVTYTKNAFHLQTKSGKRSASLEDVFEIRFAKEAYDTGDMQRVFLRSGTIFSAELGASSNFKEIPMTSASGQKIKLPGDQVAGIEFSNLNPGAQVGKTPAGSHSISINGKVVSCTIEWMSRRDLSIKTRAGRIKLKRNKLHRIMFAQTTKSPSKKENIILRTKYNDKIYAQLLSLDESHVKLRTTVGNIEYPTRDIVSISSISNRVAQLSEQKPSHVSETPYIDFIRKYKINTNLFGAPIIIDGIRYEHGIAMHSRSSLTYQLDGGYSSFVSYYAIDKSITKDGNAEFIIRSGNKELLRKNISGKDPLQFIHLNISGLASIELIIDYGKNGSGGDHGIWALPRLIK